MRSVGLLNTDRLVEEFGQLNTPEVILMDERAEHIQESHPADWELFDRYAQRTVEDPYLILKDSKHKNTVCMIGKTDESNVNVIIRLAVSGEDDKEYKNSIMTFYRIRESNLKKLIEKSKTLYIRE